jgi:hypothetical protein
LRPIGGTARIWSLYELLAEAIRTGAESIPEAFVIVDEAGRILKEVSFETLIPKAFEVDAFEVDAFASH